MKASMRETNIPRAFMSIASSSIAPTPARSILAAKVEKSGKGVPRPHRPSRDMYPRSLTSAAAVALTYSTLACGSCFWMPSTISPVFVPLPPRSSARFFARCASSKQMQPSKRAGSPEAAAQVTSWSIRRSECLFCAISDW